MMAALEVAWSGSVSNISRGSCSEGSEGSEFRVRGFFESFVSVFTYVQQKMHHV